MRVVIDTNVLVSGFLTPGGRSARILNRWQEDDFDLLVSEPILTEYEKALKYRHIRSRHRLSEEEIAELIEDLREFAILVPIRPEDRLQVIKDDPNDDKFLECAVAGGGEYIVSGDEHLLALGEYRGIHVLSPATFLAVLEEGERGL